MDRREPAADPSMDDILASIRKIMADTPAESAAPLPPLPSFGGPSSVAASPAPAPVPATSLSARLNTVFGPASAGADEMRPAARPAPASSLDDDLGDLLADDPAPVRPKPEARAAGRPEPVDPLSSLMLPGGPARTAAAPARPAPVVIAATPMLGTPAADPVRPTQAARPLGFAPSSYGQATPAARQPAEPAPLAPPPPRPDLAATPAAPWPQAGEPAADSASPAGLSAKTLEFLRASAQTPAPTPAVANPAAPTSAAPASPQAPAAPAAPAAPSPVFNTPAHAPTPVAAPVAANLEPAPAAPAPVPPPRVVIATTAHAPKSPDPAKVEPVLPFPLAAATASAPASPTPSTPAIRPAGFLSDSLIPQTARSLTSPAAPVTIDASTAAARPQPAPEPAPAPAALETASTVPFATVEPTTTATTEPAPQPAPDAGTSALEILAAGFAASSRQPLPEIVIAPPAEPVEVAEVVSVDVAPFEATAPQAVAETVAAPSPAIEPTALSVFASRERFTGSEPASLTPATSLTPAAERTLEDTAAELLRPMIRQWLDDNMPRIVERALQMELAHGVDEPKNQATDR